MEFALGGPNRSRGLAAATTSPGDWREGEAVLLRDIGRALSPHADDIAAAWTDRLVAQLPLRGRAPWRVDSIRDLNRALLADHLAKLGEGNLEAVLRTNLDNDLAMLRAQREIDHEMQATLSQLYLSLEISTTIITDRLTEIFADDHRLLAILGAYGRLALRLGQVVGEAFNQVRVEELDEALRVTSSLLDTSRQLNARSASVSEVLQRLNEIVQRVVESDKTISFLWREEEGAYVVAEALGFSATELEQARAYRFRPADGQLERLVHGGEICGGTGDDGIISRDLMDRHGVAAYAIAPLRGSDGRPLGALAAYRARRRRFAATDLQILRGVAQNAGLALENAKLVEVVEAASRLKREFINSMSHEIRTPLNILFGYLEMLYERHADDADDRDILDRMKQNSGYVLTLVNTILDIGRIESGHMPVHAVALDVDEVLANLREMFGTVAETRGLEFSCERRNQVPALVTDRLKVLEILNNLVGNAFKFTNRGAVRVEVEHSPDRAQVVFRVSDTGPGVPPESIDVIFDLFRQGAESAHGGTGLGLYIVRRLTDLLGGHVEVESVVGEGTTFRVFLPLSIESASDSI